MTAPAPGLLPEPEEPAERMEPEVRRILRALQWFVALAALLLGYYGYTYWCGGR